MKNEVMLVEAYNVNLCINCRKESALPGTSGFDAYCPACQAQRKFSMDVHGIELPRDSLGRFLPWVAIYCGEVVAAHPDGHSIKEDPVVIDHLNAGHVLVRVNLLSECGHIPPRRSGSFVGRVPF